MSGGMCDDSTIVNTQVGRRVRSGMVVLEVNCLGFGFVVLIKQFH